MTVVLASSDNLMMRQLRPSGDGLAVMVVSATQLLPVAFDVRRAKRLTVYGARSLVGNQTLSFLIISSSD
jgi:hypothetical protein